MEGKPVAGELKFSKSDWALILGSSSGFGGATAIEFARHGMNIFGVHLDRAATMPNVKQVLQDIKATGSKVLFFNINAADAARRNETLEIIVKELSTDPPATVRVFMHSLAFGTLKPYISEVPDEMITQAQMEMTLDVMANSLVYWVQGLIQRKLMRQGGRIFAMTSSGGHTVMPSYGPVSAAKAALESHVRQLAMELGPLGITANSIMAGVTDTPALRKIPSGQRLLKAAEYKNPTGRVTTPIDVAKAIVLLSDDRSQWISGNVIKVDAGEDITGFVAHEGPVHIE